jgi:hypothetical protein
VIVTKALRRDGEAETIAHITLEDECRRLEASEDISSSVAIVHSDEVHRPCTCRMTSGG